jgi:hypothetical protein
MKKLIGISSFCDSKKKINVLKSNLLKLKDLEVDTLLFTPIPLPQEIYNLCTEVIISSENPILKWPEYGMTFWETYPYLSNEIKFTLIKSDYGWASINQLKRLAQYASNLNYEFYHLMIYDLKITQEIESEIKTNITSTLYRHLSPKTKRIRPLGGIFSTFDKKTLKLFGDSLNKTQYKQSHSAENYLFKLNESLLNLQISPIVPEDLIYEDDGIHKSFNMSYFEGLDLYINNDSYLGIYFHKIKESKNITIKVNEQEYFNSISNVSYFISDIPLKNITSLSIKVNNKIEDYSLYLPQNNTNLYRFNLNDKFHLDYIKNFIKEHNINFNDL